MKNILKAALLAASASVAVQAADASTILSFGQTNDAAQFTMTANADQNATSLSASGLAITISQILDGGTIVTPIAAFLTLDATSTSAAQSVFGAYGQLFAGTFSIASDTGFNYLSGAFTGLDIEMGTAGTLTAVGDVGSFTSDAITVLGAPLGASFSFANISDAGVCGSTLCSGTSSVSGTFSASAAVPEPASWAMMVGGFGLLGTAMRRKRATTAVIFA